MIAPAATAPTDRRVVLDPAPRSHLVERLFARFLQDLDAARAAIAAGDIAAKANALDHAQRIVAELAAALDHAAAPELCRNLLAQYEFVTAQLAEANLHLVAAPLDRAQRVMSEIGAALAQVHPR